PISKTNCHCEKGRLLCGGSLLNWSLGGTDSGSPLAGGFGSRAGFSEASDPPVALSSARPLRLFSINWWIFCPPLCRSSPIRVVLNSMLTFFLPSSAGALLTRYQPRYQATPRTVRVAAARKASTLRISLPPRGRDLLTAACRGAMWSSQNRKARPGQFAGAKPLLTIPPQRSVCC